MVSVQIREINETKYVYLVKSIRLGSQTKTIEKSIGKDPMSEEEIDAKKKELELYFDMKEAELKSEYISQTAKSDYLIPGDILNLELLKNQYALFLSNLYPNELEAYTQRFDVSYVFNTTNIEGNTLSLSETKLVLVDNISPKEKELREIFEVKNYEKVLTYIQDYSGDINLDFIKKLHELIEANIDKYTLGQFRRVDVVITGSEWTPTPAILVEEDMKELLAWYNKHKVDLYPIELAALFHHRFEQIHPFNNGNGRVGRELFNFIITRAGYPKLNFEVKKRQTYIDVLQQADRKNPKPLVQFSKDSLLDQNQRVIKNFIDNIKSKPKVESQKTLDDTTK